MQVYVRKARTAVSARFFSVAEPFPDQLTDFLVSQMGHRIAASDPPASWSKQGGLG